MTPQAHILTIIIIVSITGTSTTTSTIAFIISESPIGPEHPAQWHPEPHAGLLLPPRAHMQGPKRACALDVGV